MLVPEPKRIAWQMATVAGAIAETQSARSLILDVPGWTGSVPGQHVDVRLSAPDGYQATRSYSLSSGSGEPPQITVERVDDGEVSPYLVDDVEVGDEFEVLGPVGGYFVWPPSTTALLLIGGGSGIAPLRPMWRAAEPGTATVLYSARQPDRVIFADELAELDGVSVHLTRASAPGFVEGRIKAEHLAAALAANPDPDIFVCGPTAFAEAVVSDLQAIGADASKIRTERFG